jgi:hypothetical protein
MLSGPMTQRQDVWFKNRIARKNREIDKKNCPLLTVLLVIYNFLIRDKVDEKGETVEKLLTCY